MGILPHVKTSSDSCFVSVKCTGLSLVKRQPKCHEELKLCPFSLFDRDRLNEAMIRKNLSIL